MLYISWSHLDISFGSLRLVLGQPCRILWIQIQRHVITVLRRHWCYIRGRGQLRTERTPFGPLWLITGHVHVITPWIRTWGSRHSCVRGSRVCSVFSLVHVHVIIISSLLVRGQSMVLSHIDNWVIFFLRWRDMVPCRWRTTHIYIRRYVIRSICPIKINTRFHFNITARGLSNTWFHFHVPRIGTAAGIWSGEVHFHQVVHWTDGTVRTMAPITWQKRRAARFGTCVRVMRRQHPSGSLFSFRPNTERPDSGVLRSTSQFHMTFTSAGLRPRSHGISPGRSGVVIFRREVRRNFVQGIVRESNISRGSTGGDATHAGSGGGSVVRTARRHVHVAVVGARGCHRYITFVYAWKTNEIKLIHCQR